MRGPNWKLNTSNQGKFQEFKRLFAKYGNTLETSHTDLKEIEADPIKVVAHKASQLGENIIVEDTSLDIEGASIGVNIRWLLDLLAEYAGRKAEWTVLLALRQDNQVYIYKGSVSGIIVEPRGTTGFGFDSVFLPNGSNHTLAESKPDAFNARVKAVASLLQGNVWTKHSIIENWEGPWQKSN
jgi:XTP/dITP diphosphohydrolase